jgi:single-stranded DNA-binding protein
MLVLNKVMLLGSSPEEPKLTYTENGAPQCSFTLLIAEKGQEHTFCLYVPCEVFGDRTEKVTEALGLGDTVLVDGTLRWRSWVDKTGEKEGKLAVLAWSAEQACAAMKDVRPQ